AMSSDVGIALQQVQTLAEQSREIGKVLDVIRAIAEQTNLPALHAAIEAARQDIAMPPSVELRLQGAASAFQASLSNTLWLMLAAVVTMYLVLGMLYESA
ncbi:efflux RND transporter permease subunit, partial [Cupriavidus sp. SIMBA_020]|uniref:efflux RND transporter permease subunit n=1 Tax=Cupriavidus sp. SIMBA_020 TaxID=3085766 RepID=UPI00397C1539